MELARLTSGSQALRTEGFFVPTGLEKMIRVGIAGATGYTGVETVRLVDRHPDTEIAWLTSENNAGRLYCDVVHGPWAIPLIPLADALARTSEVDVVFWPCPMPSLWNRCVHFITPALL